MSDKVYKGNGDREKIQASPAGQQDNQPDARTIPHTIRERETDLEKWTGLPWRSSLSVERIIPRNIAIRFIAVWIPCSPAKLCIIRVPKDSA